MVQVRNHVLGGDPAVTLGRSKATPRARTTASPGAMHGSARTSGRIHARRGKQDAVNCRLPATAAVRRKASLPIGAPIGKRAIHLFVCVVERWQLTACRALLGSSSPQRDEAIHRGVMSDESIHATCHGGRSVSIPVRILVSFTALALGGRATVKPVRASRQGSSPNEIRAMVVRLQGAVRNNERRTVASLILFPLEIRKDPPLGVTSVPSVTVFMTVYPSVFTKRLREALLKQDPDSVVVRSGRATFAGGRIVIGYRCSSADRGSCTTGVTEVTPFRK